MTLCYKCEDGTVEWVQNISSRDLKTIEAGCPHKGSNCTFRILSVIIFSAGQEQTSNGIPLAPSVYCKCPNSVKTSEVHIISSKIGLTSVSELDRLLEMCLTRLHVGETREFTINCARSTSSLKLALELVSIEDSTELYELDGENIIKIAGTLKEEGVKLFTEGYVIDAFYKFKQAWEYVCLQHPSIWNTSQNAKILTIKSNLASCHLKMGNWNDTIELCNMVLETDSNNVKALYRRGFSYIENQEYEKAKIDLMRAKDLEPDNKAVKNKLETLHQHQKQLDAKFADAMKKFFS